MPATLETPTDHLSGIPLAIAPSFDWLPPHLTETWNNHHAFHPGSDPNFLGPGGAALRSCRIQTVPTGAHNEGKRGYHQYYIGPEIPTDPTDVFSRLVIAAAGVIPDHVIDLSTGEPFTRPATRSELDMLRTPHPTERFSYQYFHYGYVPMRDFFRQYVLDKQLDDRHVKLSYIDEFLHTGEPDRKLFLGHLMIAKAAEVATEDARGRYDLARRAALLYPGMKSSPFWLIKYKLGNDEQRADLIPVIESRLRKLHVGEGGQPLAA